MTTPATTAPIAPLLTPIHCRRCKAIIAHAYPSGEKIKVSDNALIHERVELQCAVCGFFRRWKPQKSS